MTREIVSTQDAPMAIGPYSQAVKQDGFVFISGQVPIDPSDGELIGGSIGEQTRRAMENLGAILKSAGAGFNDIVKVTAYLTDMGDFAEFNEAYGEYFNTQPPARATVGVSALPKNARVEVECIAKV